MKTIGLLGGMSWESTAFYYKVLNQETYKILGGLHSAPIVMVSVDFHEIEQCQAQNNWALAAKILTDHAHALEQSGADFILLCTNTMHKILPNIQQQISIPFLHIAQSVSNVILENKIQKIGLLGTRFTMQEDFFKNVLIQNGIEVIVPQITEQNRIDEIIYHQLCQGIVQNESKKEYLAVVDNLIEKGAQGVVAGCTEIGLLIQSQDVAVPFYDTALIHAQAAVRYALS